MAAAVLLVAAAAAPAAAHNGLVSSDPAEGATLARTPEAVVLTFDEPAVSMGTQMLVTGPDGPAAAGPVQLVDATVRLPLLEGAPAGAYTVDWRVTSADGHPVTGRLSFTAAAPGAGTYAGPPATTVDTPAEQPAWSWVGLAAVLLAAGGTIALLRRRHHASA